MLEDACLSTPWSIKKIIIKFLHRINSSTDEVFKDSRFAFGVDEYFLNKILPIPINRYINFNISTVLLFLYDFHRDFVDNFDTHYNTKDEFRKTIDKLFYSGETLSQQAIDYYYKFRDAWKRNPVQPAFNRLIPYFKYKAIYIRKKVIVLDKLLFADKISHSKIASDAPS